MSIKEAKVEIKKYNMYRPHTTHWIKTPEEVYREVA